MAGTTTGQQTIAVLSVSAGAGHVRAAQAIQAAAERWYDGVNVVHLDIMDLVPQLFRRAYAESYIKVVERFPAFWGYLYQKTDQEKMESAVSRMRLLVERLNTQKLKLAIRVINPDHVICTHFLPAELLSRWKRKGSFHKPVWVQVTDFDVHSLWIHKYLAGYFVANDEVLWRASERGVPRETIRVTGIPIMPAFSDKQSRAECAAELGLDSDKTTIIMMSGGAGVGDLNVLAARLLQLDADFQLVALAGKNRSLLSSLEALARRSKGRLFPLPFTKTIERVMAAGDLAITKPGGLTTSECLAVGLPMIVVSPIPGQEERNADFLLENNAALKACDPASLAYKVDKLLREPRSLASLRKNAIRIGKPDAARKVLDIVLAGS